VVEEADIEDPSKSTIIALGKTVVEGNVFENTWLWVIIGAVGGICLVFVCAYCCCQTADEYEFDPNQDGFAENVFNRYD